VGRKGDFYNGHELISGSGNVFAGGWINNRWLQ
jgi:hypothetical protein